MMKKFDLTDTLIFNGVSTGVAMTDEFIEIGIIDGQTGEVLLETFLKPTKLIPDEVINIYGITNEMISDAPTWSEIQPQFVELVYGKYLLTYNVDFYRRILLQTASINGTGAEILNYYRDEQEYTSCDMLFCEEFLGKQCNCCVQFKWEDLMSSVSQYGIDHSDLVDKKVISSCEVMRRIIKKLNREH